MKANTLSLLNSHWMITDSGASSLMPELISLLKGIKPEKIEGKLPVVYMSMDDEGMMDVPEMTSNSQYICVLSVKSPLFKYDQYCGPTGTRSMARVLKEWEANDNVVGVVLDIDCPGGQVSGLAEFANYISNYSKPIVSYTDGLVASAAFYIAAATKHIVVNQYADFIGSIGTMLKTVDFDGILEKEGATVREIYATGSSRKNEESRELKKGNESLVVKNILDPMRNNFVADMEKYRPGMNAEVFDGAIYVPTEALSLGLIDSIGTLQDAFDKVVALSKATKKPSTNQNTNTMSKSLPKVEAVLGLTAPLAITENGSYLNEEQLDQIEARIDTLETENSNMTTQLSEASTANETAVNAITEKLTDATNSLTVAEASVDAALTSSGLPVAGTLTEKLTALNSYATVQGAKDGAGHTKPKTDANADGTANLNIGGVDVAAYLNN